MVLARNAAFRSLRELNKDNTVMPPYHCIVHYEILGSCSGTSVGVGKRGTASTSKVPHTTGSAFTSVSMCSSKTALDIRRIKDQDRRQIESQIT